MRTVDSEERKNFLKWLAECQRDNSIVQARDFQIDPEWLEIPDLKPQAEHWQAATFDLSYEPRSLAVSPRGRQVAVGTKAGQVCLAVWDDKSQRWSPRTVSKEDIRDGRNPERRSSPSAIRGLIILDERTLVAAWGLASFSIVRFSSETAEPDVIVLDSKKELGDGEARLGSQRFSRLVHLYPPQGPVPDTGDLVLGIPRGGDLHVLGIEGGRYVRRKGSPETIFPRWDPQMGRLVDGVWQHGILWLLTSKGWLVRYSIDPGHEPVWLAQDPIDPPRQNAMFRRLGACEAGLSMLAGESVGLQWLDWKEEKAYPDLEAGPVHWFDVPEAMDCAPCVPYPQGTDPRQICNSRFDWRNPVWSVVSTAGPGLRWISWTNPRLRTDPSQAAGETRPWAHAAPANFAVSGGGSILYVGFGRSGSALSTPPFLACGTRDHKLLIASVLDRWKCDREVGEQMARTASGAAFWEKADGARGIQWWYLRRRIQADFGTLKDRLPPEELGLDPVRLLDCTDHNNLRFIASKLVEWRDLAFDRERKANRGNPALLAERAETFDSVLTLWILRLLLRAKQLGADVDRAITLLLCEKLQVASGEAVESEDRLISLAGFLRKWIINGDTYGEKTSGIHNVYLWNRECGRNLDALVYLTRLIRHRVDQNWEAAPAVRPWTSTVWSLVPGVDGEFSIVSLADGGICAVSGDGVPVPWKLAQDPASVEKDYELCLRNNDLRLERSESEGFEKLYRHGPYSRSLWLTQVGGPPSGQTGDREYLLVFCLKGWRREDRPQGGREPRVYALRLRSRLESGGGKRVRELSVEAIGSTTVCNELYSLCTLEIETDRMVLVAGTSLSWKTSLDPEPEKWTPQPFVELTIEMQPGSIDLQVVPTKIERFEESERSVLRRESVPPETAYNPCWSLVRSEITADDGTQEVWLWAGFQDGNIRGYRRVDNGGRFWQEKSRGREESRPVRRGLKTTGAVWRLLEFKGRGGEPMLAYGTGDGVVGAVSMRELLRTEAGDPVGFLVHTREREPICGLLCYHDQAAGTALPFLLAVTQAGVICIFSLDYIQRSESGGPADSRWRGYRLQAPGFRVDRFRLPHTLRAISWIGAVEGAKLQAPRFVYGSAEGKVYDCTLAFPSYSQRRWDLVAVFNELSQAAKEGRSVRRIVPQIEGQAGRLLMPYEAGATLHLWLRAMRTGDSLLRYSLWDELRRAGQEIWDEPEEASDEQVERSFGAFKDKIEILAAETYRRIPFSKEPAEILWHEAGKIASHIAVQALKKQAPSAQSDGRIARRLRHYLELNVLSSDLCNRWIGAEQTIERNVLIQSVSEIFDWTAIILIASEQQPEEDAEKVRRFLVYNLIQRRLNFPDSIVPLETLRTINAAIFRAILNNRKGVIEPRDLKILSSREPGGQGPSSHGFYDLMTMVGDLWERQSPALSPSDPLVTEIVRFFSLSLLLLPNCALLTGQVVSESRLTESGPELAKIILSQARELRAELLAIAGTELWQESLEERGLKLFQACFGQSVNFAIAEVERPIPDTLPPDDDERWPWHYLLWEGDKLKDREPTDELSDQNILLEMCRVLRAAAWISDLDRPGQFDIDKRREELRAGTAAPSGFTEPVDWILDLDRHPSKFFKHSGDYLDRLIKARQKVRRQAGLVAGPADTEKSIRRALDTCDAELARLNGEYLFRPQRDHYRQVIQRWRDQLVNRAGEAVQVVEILDQFNRHVYRTSADNLMDNIVDLAMQTAPISFAERGEAGRGVGAGSLRPLLHDRLLGFPLVQEVFETSERLVESTHLAGALLAVARGYVGKPGELGLVPSSHNVEMREIEDIIEEAAHRNGLPANKGKWVVAAEDKAPGIRAIWDLIAYEFANNIYKYSRVAPPGNGRWGGVKVKYGIQEDEQGRLCVLISSNVSYRSSLKEEEQRLLASVDPGTAVDALEAGLARLLKARERGHVDGRGAGMGLYMIDKITDLIGLEASLRLLDPESSFERRPPAERYDDPLCLVIALPKGAQP